LETAITMLKGNLLRKVQKSRGLDWGKRSTLAHGLRKRYEPKKKKMVGKKKKQSYINF